MRLLYVSFDDKVTGFFMNKRVREKNGKSTKHYVGEDNLITKTERVDFHFGTHAMDFYSDDNSSTISKFFFFFFGRIV